MEARSFASALIVSAIIIGHGRRRKQAHDEDHDWILIRRGLCYLCGKTFTFLPIFSPPYTHYACSIRTCESIGSNQACQ